MIAAAIFDEIYIIGNYVECGIEDANNRLGNRGNENRKDGSAGAAWLLYVLALACGRERGFCVTTNSVIDLPTSREINAS